MKLKLFLMLFSTIGIHHSILNAQSFNLEKPTINKRAIFEEKNGIIAIEAEHFTKQSKNNLRQWYLTTKNKIANVGRDDDTQHCYEASNNAYIEILPDTRVTHSDKLIRGENFSDKPGEIAILNYKVKFNNSGRYYVWVRAKSTGTEDNGIHVGLNNTWPESGQRMQWCDGKGNWTWESKQRTKKEHCGIPNAIYLDIDKTGTHNIQFSMREDGFEFDKFILTNNINYVPVKKGPKPILVKGKLPKPFPVAETAKPQDSYFISISKSLKGNSHIAAQEFPIDGTDFYKNGKNWLAINPNTHKEATTSTTFNFESGNYDIVFVGVGENDGRSTFSLLINSNEIGTYNPPLSKRLWEEGKKFNALWKNINLNKGDKITVKAKIGSDGEEWTRGRWAGIVFTPVGQGKKIQDSPSTFTFEK
ncbi:hypothetical protein [uncultured Algibacter sp.]|uniref:hypothetical protein n=1 Tax=uncultured Algibacter sp. TaxID=298659 RepID=UPI00261CBB0E|nr:hypothetical protein [uncultured Algibacter sp.]